MTPTGELYTVLDQAYRFYNTRLFSGTLPECVLSLRSTRTALGYFCRDRFADRDGENVKDEIALNAKAFNRRPDAENLSTLVHEMVHLQQQHFGNPGRGRYHNKEWGTLMERVGLVPSHTGKPGGKRTGQSVSHYIVESGPFDMATQDLLADGTQIPFGDIQDIHNRKPPTPSKIKYRCRACGLNVWGKPDIRVLCGDCDALMVA